jgi:hypothetical protein
MKQKTLTAMRTADIKFPRKQPTHLHAPPRTCNTDLTELDQLNAVGHPEARGCSCRLGSLRQPILYDVTVVQGPQSTDGLWDEMPCSLVCPGISEGCSTASVVRVIGIRSTFIPNHAGAHPPRHQPLFKVYLSTLQTAAQSVVGGLYSGQWAVQ